MSAPQSDLLDFYDQVARDLAAKIRRPLAEYLQRFPGHEAVVADEYAVIVEGKPPKDAAIFPSRATPAEAPPPKDFGPYRLIRELGRGGQGVVWLAEDPKLSRRVALKVLFGFGPIPAPMLERFRREVAATARLSEPGVCAVHDAGVIDGTPYIAMQFIEGESLSAQLRAAGKRRTKNSETVFEGGSAPRAAAERATKDDPGSSASKDEVGPLLTLFESTARTLHAIHEAGIVHRDIKPANIMVDTAGRPVIMDFGLARDDDADLATLTRTGDLFGTAAYMAPEQLSREGIRVDRRADVWALGVSIHEALAGQRPFEAPTRDGLYHAILTREPESLARACPAAPRDLAIVVLTALAKNRDQRYQTALDLAEELGRVRRHEPIRARPPSFATRVIRFAQRQPVAAAGIGVALAGVVVGAVALFVYLRETETTLRQSIELSDLGVASDLERRAGELWPARPGLLPSLQTWMTTAQGLLARAPAHRASLARLESSRVWHGQVVAGLVAAIDRIAVLSTDISRRTATASTIHEQSIASNEARDRWQACLDDLKELRRFEDLDLQPQLGLLPLGRDRDSRLWEFWAVDSGPEPAWEGERLAGCVRLNDDFGIVLVLLPGGDFVCGAQAQDELLGRYDPNAAATEERFRPSRLPAFFISKFEVTQGQWTRLLGVNPSNSAVESRAEKFKITPRFPVDSISSDDARQALRRIALDLPTQAAWEYAARGGTDTPWWSGGDAKTLSGAENLADRCLRAGGYKEPIDENLDDGFAYLAPVGSLRPNPFGLFDMLGNVTEWCRWAHQLDDPVPSGEPKLSDEQRAHYRPHRGGSYRSLPVDARSSRRVHNQSVQRTYYFGARAARQIEIP